MKTLRANHAGGGDPAVLAAVASEDYGDYPPATHYHQGESGAVDGNRHRPDVRIADGPGGGGGTGGIPAPQLNGNRI